jgi:hypothetical protein
MHCGVLQQFPQSSNRSVQTGTVQASQGPVQDIFVLRLDQSPICWDRHWAGLDWIGPVHACRIGPNTLGVTDTLSQETDSYTYTDIFIMPFTSHNAHITLHPSLLPTCHSPRRELPDVHGRWKIHHRHVTYLHRKQLRHLCPPASAWFLARCLSNLLPQLLLLVFPPAAVME